MMSPTQWTWFGWTPGVGDGQGGLGCCGSWGRKESGVPCSQNTLKSVFNSILICSLSFSPLRIKSKHVLRDSLS